MKLGNDRHSDDEFDDQIYIYIYNIYRNVNANGQKGPSSLSIPLESGTVSRKVQKPEKKDNSDTVPRIQCVTNKEVVSA